MPNPARWFAWKGALAVACDRCGKAFSRSPSAAKSRTLFCSYSCSASYHARRIETSEQFWSRVARSGPGECWRWTGYCNPAGYGQTAWKGKVWLAHRVALTLTDGDYDNKLPVCHTCDNPPCCNPAHLWRGTVSDNAKDMVAKGRQRHEQVEGERHGMVKLTEAAVRDIRTSNLGRRHLAEKHGVAKTYIDQIRRRASWRHIP